MKQDFQNIIYLPVILTGELKVNNYMLEDEEKI